MVVKIQKWGNSLGLRIPKPLAEEAHVGPGSRMDLAAENGRLILRPLKPNKYRLDDLLSKVSNNNMHTEAGPNDSMGRERI